MKNMHATMTLGLAAVAMLTVAVAPAAARGGKVHQKSELESTGADDDARGVARLQVRNGTDGRFDLSLKKLDKRAQYEVVVNGIRVGTVTTNGGGNAGIHFRSRPRSSKDQLLGFDPRGASVVVRRDDGTDVLSVTMTDDTPAGGATIVCCVPDDSGTECEDRTADECAAQGGTASTATSCLPNPCADVVPAPGPEVICCIPDDSGAECEDRTSADCAAEGGVVVAATSCTPNPCAPTPPVGEDEIQCCLPDNGAFECEDRTPGECAALGGTNMGAGTCTPDPCAALGTAPTGTDDHGGGAGTSGDDGPGHQ